MNLLEVRRCKTVSHLQQLLSVLHLNDSELEVNDARLAAVTHLDGNGDIGGSVLRRTS